MTTLPAEIKRASHEGLQDSVAVNPQEAKSQRTLIAAAHPLLLWIAQIDKLAPPQSVEELRTQLTRAIQAFEHQAKLSGTPAVTVLTARYLLCTFIDEMILQQQWSFQNAWSQQSLLSIFHQETWGGERFFEILTRLQQDPAFNLECLILIYTCLSLGFQGKFRLEKTGKQQLENIHQQLFQLIKVHAPPTEDLHLHRYQPIVLARKKRLTPKWIVTITLVLLLIIFGSFKLTLHQKTQTVVNQLNKVVQPFIKGEVPYENL